MMLTNEVAIVLKSTWLGNEHLFYFLKLIAYPWSYFPELQPTMELIERSRTPTVGLWTRYVLTALFCYGILLRMIILPVVSAFLWRGVGKEDKQNSIASLARRIIFWLLGMGILVSPQIIILWG